MDVNGTVWWRRGERPGRGPGDKGRRRMEGGAASSELVPPRKAAHARWRPMQREAWHGQAGGITRTEGSSRAGAGAGRLGSTPRRSPKPCVRVLGRSTTRYIASAGRRMASRAGSASMYRVAAATMRMLARMCPSPPPGTPSWSDQPTVFLGVRGEEAASGAPTPTPKPKPKPSVPSVPSICSCARRGSSATGTSRRGTVPSGSYSPASAPKNQLSSSSSAIVGAASPPSLRNDPSRSAHRPPSLLARDMMVRALPADTALALRSLSERKLRCSRGVSAWPGATALRLRYRVR